MRVGYARVSTTDQSPELQLDALRRAGCEKIFTETAVRRASDDRPELRRVLADVLRAGDTLVVWKLDRLARSLKKLITTAEELEAVKIGLGAAHREPRHDHTGRHAHLPRVRGHRSV